MTIKLLGSEQQTLLTDANRKIQGNIFVIHQDKSNKLSQDVVSSISNGKEKAVTFLTEHSWALLQNYEYNLIVIATEQQETC